MPRGGAREGSGRKPGSGGKLAEQVRVYAQPYGERAIRRLAKLGGLDKGAKGAADSAAAQVAALNSILDRAYGKPKQPVEGEMLHGISEELRKLMDENADAEANFLGFADEAKDPNAALN